MGERHGCVVYMGVIDPGIIGGETMTKLRLDPITAVVAVLVTVASLSFAAALIFA